MSDFDHRLTPKQQVRAARVKARNERTKALPFPAKLGATALLSAMVAWVFVSCSVSFAEGTKRVDCRAELVQVLEEAGSDRQPTEREIDACVAGVTG